MEKKVVVVGGGPGGYVAAIRAAQLGAQVTLIEKQHIGGTCLNIGCIPTKCFLNSAQLIESNRKEGKKSGVEAEGLRVDFDQIIRHKNDISKKLTGGVALLLQMNNVNVTEGEAFFTAPGKLSVKSKGGVSEDLTADAIILSTGSVNTIPPIPGIRDNPSCIDSTGALSLEKLPESMAVIGGGVIGLELACAYAAFGTNVTVIEALPNMLPVLDADLTKIGVKHMKKMGISFFWESPVQYVEKTPSGSAVIFRDNKGEEKRVEAEKVLIAVGRRANTDLLDLCAGQIDNNRGHIIVNDRMETNIPGIYAIGDCVYGHVQLAHTASAMGEVAAENICGIGSHYDEKTSPACVYIEPEAASVGLTEEQCRKQNIEYKVGKFPLGANGKALIMNGGEGLVKIIADAGSEMILGMHIIGPRATDLIAEGALAIKMNAKAEDLIKTIHPHPTVSEAVREAALNVQKRAIHTGN